MKNASNILAIIALLVILSLFGCGDDNGNGPAPPPTFNAITLDIYDGISLPTGFLYRLWASPVSSSLSTSTAADWTWLADFNLAPGGEGLPMHLTTTDGELFADNLLQDFPVDLDDYDSLFVTIEETGNSTDEPSATLIFRGLIPEELEHGKSSGFTTVPALPVTEFNFFTLVTPTDDVVENDTSGVWFIRGVTTYQQGLDLGEAPTGWLYESWVWHDGIWLSMGKFADPAEGDDFSGYSETINPPPGFPGEDFLINPPAGTTFPWVLEPGDSVAVSIEPDPDVEEDQFGTRLMEFRFKLDDPVHAGGAYQLQGSLIGMPDAKVFFKRSDQL
jgi:hypothetical protein